MFHRFRAFRVASDGAKRRVSGGLAPYPWVSLPLLFGLVPGAVAGLYFSLPTPVPASGFPEALWHSGCFVLAALLLATSFLGFVFIPALSAFRGFLLGCCVAASLQSDALRGLWQAFLSYGVPALLGISAFLLAASDAMACSLQLLRCFSRGEFRPPEIPTDFSRRLAAVVFLCLTEAIYTAFLLPAILGCFS